MNVKHVPVLIVGAGAAGLATSALLAKHKVGSLLVEKRREIFIYPKARNLSFRSLEILRGLGLDEQVHTVADRVSDMVVKPTLNSVDEKPAIDIDALFAGLDQFSPEPAVQYCPQSSLEPMLLAETRRRGGEVRYGTELCSFEKDDSGLAAVLRDVNSGGSETVCADYLVAADGVHSLIRTSLGLSTSGYGPLPIFVVFIYFRGPWRLIPFCFTRLNVGLTMAGWLSPAESEQPPMRNNVGYYLRENVFITSSGFFDLPVFDCARVMLGLDNLMFSVDYPFQDNFAATEFLERCGLSAEEKERFAHRTADELLKLDGGHDGDPDRPAFVSDTWYRLRSRAQSRIGRALISALVK